jgi:hypothetical protein
MVALARKQARGDAVGQRESSRLEVVMTLSPATKFRRRSIAQIDLMMQALTRSANQKPSQKIANRAR